LRNIKTHLSRWKKRGSYCPKIRRLPRIGCPQW